MKYIIEGYLGDRVGEIEVGTLQDEYSLKQVIIAPHRKEFVLDYDELKLLLRKLEDDFREPEEG